MAAALTAISGVTSAFAQTPTAPEPMVTAHGQIVVGAQTLRYTTQTGMLPLYDNDTGALMGRIFVIAYTLDRAPGEPARPLTFIWNGGPGSSSSQTHLLGFGPKGFRTPATYPEWGASPPTQIVDRPETWLVNSDLVFVDPIGTGYSRVTSEKNRDILYTTRGDVEAVAEAIRIYRTRNEAWDAPLFLVGESYGTTRAMGVAEALEKRRTRVAGVVLISGDYEVGQSVPQALARALEVPSYAAAAYYHKRLSAELQALPREQLLKRVIEWARNDYAQALERPSALTPAQRASVVERLSAFTGIEPRYVDAKALSLGDGVFTDNLLPERALGRYDTRMVGPKRGADNPIWVPTTDPSILPMLDIMQGTSVPLIRYLRDTLQFKNDLLYAGPFGEAFHPSPLNAVAPQIWGPYTDWMTMKWNRAEAPSPASQAKPAPGMSKARPPAAGSDVGPPFNKPPPLRRAMDLDPRLLVMNVTGIYDSYIGSCAEKDEAVARSEAPIRSRVRNACYDAGHEVYTDIAVRKAFQIDFARFVHDATPTRPAAAGR
jgi:carboxypeptidase C (cathepsin A)